MAINSKVKGATGEREIAKILKEKGFTGARRGQQYCGANGDADVIGIEGVHIEVKRVEKLNVENALKQAERDKKENEIATVFHRKNREEWKVTLRLDDFINLYKELKDKESKIQDLEKRELWR